MVVCLFSGISTPRFLGGSTGEARDVGQIDPFGEGRFWLSAFQQDLNQEDSHYEEGSTLDSMNSESESFLRTGSSFYGSRLESTARFSKNTESNMISEGKVKRRDPYYNKEEWLQDERAGPHK